VRRQVLVHQQLQHRLPRRGQAALLDQDLAQGSAFIGDPGVQCRRQGFATGEVVLPRQQSEQ
jgi:hypothetical protein